MELFKKDLEIIFNALDAEMKKHHIDSKQYKEIEDLYSYLDEHYQELLEVNQEETEDYDRQCMGCGSFISGGRICRECSGVMIS